MSDIRDLEAFIRGRWKWTGFGYEKGFPRGCQFSDVDAVVEFDGWTLYIEAKHFDGIGPPQPLSTGQSLLLKRLAEQENVTVLVLWGCASCNDPYLVLNVATREVLDWRTQTKEVRRKELKALIDAAMGVR